MIMTGCMVTNTCSLVKLQLEDDYTETAKVPPHTATCSLISTRTSETMTEVSKPLACHRGLSSALLHGPSASELSDLLAVEKDGNAEQS